MFKNKFNRNYKKKLFCTEKFCLKKKSKQKGSNFLGACPLFLLPCPTEIICQSLHEFAKWFGQPDSAFFTKKVSVSKFHPAVMIK